MDLTGKPSTKQSYQLNHRNKDFFLRIIKNKMIKGCRQGVQMFPGDAGLIASAGFRTSPWADL